MEQNEFHDGFSRLAARWGRKTTIEQEDIYFDCVQFIPTIAWREIVQHIVERFQHFPSPGEIKDAWKEWRKENPDKLVKERDYPDCDFCKNTGQIEFYARHRNCMTLERALKRKVTWQDLGINPQYPPIHAGHKRMISTDSWYYITEGLRPCGECQRLNCVGRPLKISEVQEYDFLIISPITKRKWGEICHWYDEKQYGKEEADKRREKRMSDQGKRSVKDLEILALKTIGKMKMPGLVDEKQEQDNLTRLWKQKTELANIPF